MSRVGGTPVEIPDGVTISVDGTAVTARGAQGELFLETPEGISVAVDGSQVKVSRADDTKKTRSLHGLVRGLIAGMVEGVARGYTKELEIEGVGYKAEVRGRDLVLSLGYSSPVECEAPEGVTFQVDGNKVKVSGADKQKVGDMAARVRAVCPPEPYKGKGIRYSGEYVRRKAGKAVA